MTSDPSAPARTEPVLASAVERLAEGHAPLLDAVTARARAVEALSRQRPGAPTLEALAALLPEAGMRPIQVRQGLEVVSRGDPASRYVVEGAGRLWQLSRSQAPGHLELEALGAEGAPEGLIVAEAARRLGVSPGAELEMLEAAVAQPLEPAHVPHATPVQQLWALLRVERADLWVVAIYAVGYGLLSLATPVAVQSLVNTVAFGSLLQPMLVLTLMVALALGFGALLRSMQAWVVEQVQQRLMARVALDLGGRLTRAQESALEGGAGQELLNRFFDVLTVQKSVSTFLMEGLLLVLQASMGLLLLAFYHPALLAFDVALVVLGLGVLVLAGRGGTKTAIVESREKYALAAWLEEIARVPAPFRGPHGAAWARFQVEERLRGWLAARRTHHGVWFRQLAGAYALQAVAATALLALGGWLVIQRQLTLGQLVAAEFVVTTVLSSVTRLGKQMETWYDALAAADKLGHLLDVPLEDTGAGQGLPGTGPLKLALPGLSEVNPGEKVAVLAPPGTGKSWLVRAMWGLETPGPGRVSLDGRDVLHLDRYALREAVALVRGVECFRGTVLDNVAVGRPGVDRERALGVLEAVGLRAVVQGLAEADRTVLSGSGAPLTRGEARRLMFARALAARPRLLVVDDGLDDVEADARERLAALLAPAGGKAPWTLVVFAREKGDALVRRCDRVVQWEGRQP